MSEQCTFPFCEEAATDSMLRFYEDRTLESYLCRKHAKLLLKEFDRTGKKYKTGPIKESWIEYSESEEERSGKP